MRRFEQAFNLVATIRGKARGETTKLIKKRLGYSTKNNRTLTVSQTITYLLASGYIQEATVLNTVKDILKDEILSRRKNRTDAIDINELVSVYRIVVMNGRSDTYRRRIGNALAKVG